MNTLTEKDKKSLELELKLRTVQKWTIFGIMIFLALLVSLYGLFTHNSTVHYFSIPLTIIFVISLIIGGKDKKNILEAIERNTKESVSGTITNKRAIGKTPSFYFILDNNKEIHLETVNAFKYYKNFNIGDCIELERLPGIGVIIEIKKK